jgi:hypothetical protein
MPGTMAKPAGADPQGCDGRLSAGRGKRQKSEAPSRSARVHAAFSRAIQEAREAKGCAGERPTYRYLQKHP